MCEPTPFQTNAVITPVASSATSVTLLSERVGRRGATLWNSSTQVLYVALAATASAAAATAKVAADAHWTAPEGYNGVISGIWASANGNALVTEIF